MCPKPTFGAYWRVVSQAPPGTIAGWPQDSEGPISGISGGKKGPISGIIRRKKCLISGVIRRKEGPKSDENSKNPQHTVQPSIFTIIVYTSDYLENHSFQISKTIAKSQHCNLCNCVLAHRRCTQSNFYNGINPSALESIHALNRKV